MADSQTTIASPPHMRVRSRRLLALFAVLALLTGVLVVQRTRKRAAPPAAPVAKVALENLLFPSNDVTTRLKNAVTAQPNSAQAHLDLAGALAKQSFYMAALHEYRAALGQGAQAAEVHRALAQVYEHLSRRTEAVQEYRLAAQIDPNAAWRSLELARALHRGGEAKEALSLLDSLPKAIEKITPPAERLPLWRTLGSIYAEAGDLDRCDRMADRILAQVPDDVGALQVKAQGQLAHNRFEPAAQLLRQSLASVASADPKEAPPPPITANLHYLLADTLNRTAGIRQTNEILSHLQQAIQLDPEQGWAYYTLGRLYAEQKRWKESADAFLKARSVGVETADLLRRAAIAHRQMGDTGGSLLLKGLYHQTQNQASQAIRTYTEILTLPDYREAAALQLVKIHRQAHAYDKALAVLQDLIAKNPASVPAYQALVDVYGDKEDFKNRTATLNKLKEIAPSMEEYVYREMGAWSYYLQKHDEAEKYFEQCLRLAPNDAAYHAAIARSCLQQTAQKEKLAKALDALEHALALEPNHAGAYRLLGQALQQANRPEEAARAYERSIDLEPGRGDAYSPLIQLYRNLGRGQDAQEIAKLFQRYQEFHNRQSALEREIILHPKNRQTYLNLADFFLHAKDYSHAAEQLEKSVRLDATDPSVHEALATCYRQMNRPSEADQALQRAARLLESGKPRTRHAHEK